MAFRIVYIPDIGLGSKERKMATVEIKSARIDRMIGQKGFSCSTTYVTRNGEPKKQSFTIWTEELAGYKEGDVLNIRGLLSVRLEEWDDRVSGQKRQKAAIHVNQPQITRDDSEVSAKSANLEGVWPEAKQINDEAPF